MEDVTLNFNELQEASLVIRSLNHALKCQQILNLLEEFGSMTVTSDLYQTTNRAIRCIAAFGHYAKNGRSQNRT